MHRSPRAVVRIVALFTLFTLTACGSGGDDTVSTADEPASPAAPAAPAAPTADQTACFPSLATYDQLVLHTTPEEAVKRIGCAGYEPPAQPGTGSLKFLHWIDGRSDARAFELVFDPMVGLIRRSGYFTGDDQPKSACVPTQAVFDQVVAGADEASVVRLFGCDGELRVDLLSIHGGHEKRYAWGHYGHPTLPMAFVVFTNGVVREKMSARLQ